MLSQESFRLLTSQLTDFNLIGTQMKYSRRLESSYEYLRIWVLGTPWRYVEEKLSYILAHVQANTDKYSSLV